MSNKEAAKLIIENIQMLDDSYTVTESVENNIFDEIYAFIEENVEEFSKDSIEEFSDEWFGKYVHDETWPWFAPKKWQVGQGDSLDTLAAYYLAARLKSDADDNWSLTSLFASGKSSYGFWVELDRSQFQKKPTVRELKAFTLGQNQTHFAIEKAGFKFYPEDGAWFLPFTLDVNQVAENYVSDNLVDAFVPITDALKKLQEAHPHFVNIIEEAKKAFGGVALNDVSET